MGLGFVAGFVDTFGFVALFLLFTAHVTGNFVLIGAALVKSGPGILAKLLALPVFMVAVACVCVFVRLHERVGRPVLTSLLVLQIVLLAGFMAAGLAFEPFAEADQAGAVVTGLIGVAAMAIQNAGWRQRFIPAIISFAAGAIAGAVAFARADYWGLVLPLAVLATLTITERPARTQPQAS